ncbi:hypothetical protein FIBSPDRAFT_903691, partial [Athelia psychrophila]
MMVNGHWELSDRIHRNPGGGKLMISQEKAEDIGRAAVPLQRLFVRPQTLRTDDDLEQSLPEAMASPARPAWQTDDLEDEWIDNDEEDDNNNDDEQNGSQSMSLSMTTPGTMHIINASIHDGDSDGEPTSDPDAGGTFL